VQSRGVAASDDTWRI